MTIVLIILGIILVPVVIRLLFSILEPLFDFLQEFIFWVLLVVGIIVGLILLFAFVPLDIVLPILGVVVTLVLTVLVVIFADDHPIISALFPVILLILSTVGYLNNWTLWICIPASIMACYIIAFRGWEDAGSITEYHEYGYYEYGIWHSIGERVKIIDLGLPGLFFNFLFYVVLPLIGKYAMAPILIYVSLGVAIIRMIVKLVVVFND